MLAPVLAVQMGMLADFVMFSLLLGQHAWSARPPNITCGNETGLFHSKNSNKIPPQNYNVKSAFFRCGLCCKSDSGSAKWLLMQCVYCNPLGYA